VEIGLLFREIRPGTVKVGFRSKGDIDISILAARFGGGGHRQAAGASLEGSLDEVKELVISAARDVIA
jgi:phosphoesterase RecJ-like protein